MNVNKIINTFYFSQANRYSIMFPNVHFISGYEMDICTVRNSGYVEEIEIKTSKSDFKQDFKKTVIHGGYPNRKIKNKHEELKKGNLMANYFSFFIPVWMVSTVTIPEYAGVYTFREFSDDSNSWFKIYNVKKPKILHKNKIEDKVLLHLSKKMTYRYWSLRIKDELY